MSVNVCQTHQLWRDLTIFVDSLFSIGAKGRICRKILMALTRGRDSAFDQELVQIGVFVLDMEGRVAILEFK